MSSELVEMYQSGMSLARIGQHTGKSASTIRRILKTAGIELRRSGGRATFDVNLAIKLWNEGNTCEEIGRVVGVNKTAVFEQLVKHGIDTSRILDRTLIGAMLSDGCSDIEIAAHFDCRPDTIANIRRTEFGKFADHIERSRTLISQLRSDVVNTELSFHTLLERYSGLSRATVTKIFDEVRTDRAVDVDNAKVLDNNYDDIVSMLKDGCSISEIKRRYNIHSQRTIDAFIKEHVPDYDYHDVKIPTKVYDLLTNADWCKQIAYDCRASGAYGISRKIVELTGHKVSESTVLRYMDIAGVRCQKWTSEELYPILNDRDALDDMYKTKSLLEIANDIGCSHLTIRRKFIEHDIEIRRDHLTSKLEKQISQHIIDLVGSENVLLNDRTILGGKELDIVIPHLRIAVEVCGIYWHSEEFKPNNYHRDKMVAANAAGYRLITIFEDEWVWKEQIVRSKLAAILQRSSDRLYARKCKIIELSHNEACTFLDLYHIQGRSSDSVRYGLIHNDELVAVMTFKASMHNSDAVELNRFATSVSVVGGFSKLLKHAMSNNDWKIVDTFADLRWSSIDNNVYQKNGFELVHVTDPAYFYVDKISVMRMHRMNFQKKLLKDKLSVYDDTLTERQNVNNAGIFAIYDCGNIKYRIHKQ